MVGDRAAVASSPLTDGDYKTLGRIRRTLREFTRFSEQAAERAGLKPQQHQALLAIRAEKGLTVGELAARLSLRPHSATGLVDRLERLGLVARQPSEQDRRQTTLALTASGEEILKTLSETHRAELRRLRPLLAALLAEV